MAKYFALFLLTLPLCAQAFDFSKLKEMASDPEKMQQAAERMAQEAQKASECIDQAGLQNMQEESQAVQNKIEALCSKGDRAGAEKVAIDYSRKLISSTEYQQLQKCTEQLRSMMPQEFMQEIQRQAQAANSDAGEVKHICDM